jgi:hypothetical protein
MSHNGIDRVVPPNSECVNDVTASSQSCPSELSVSSSMSIWHLLHHRLGSAYGHSVFIRYTRKIIEEVLRWFFSRESDPFFSESGPGEQRSTHEDIHLLQTLHFQGIMVLEWCYVSSGLSRAISSKDHFFSSIVNPAGTCF